MDQTNSIINFLFAFLMAAIVPPFIQWIGKKISKKEIASDNNLKESTTAKNISDAANVTIKSAQEAIDLFTETIVNPLREELKVNKAQIEELKESLKILQKNDEERGIEISSLRLDNARKTLSLTYLVEKIRDTHPDEISYAFKIMRGEARYEPENPK